MKMLLRFLHPMTTTLAPQVYVGHTTVLAFLRCAAKEAHGGNEIELEPFIYLGCVNIVALQKFPRQHSLFGYR